MAGDIRLLDHLTRGRAYLGVARGAWLEKHGIHELKPSVAAIRECVQCFSDLLAGKSGFDGSIFHIDPSVRLPYQPFRERVPILIGTWGKQLGAVAGELADEGKIGGGKKLAMISGLRVLFAGGVRKGNLAGRGGRIAFGGVTAVERGRRRTTE